MYKPLSSYGIIGNCRSCALIGKDGSIDFSCLPNFDSGAYFCALLDDEKGGFFKISPKEGFYQSNQRYKVGHHNNTNYPTNILKTFFFNQLGNVVITDFMPITKQQDLKNDIPEYGLKIIRKVKALIGHQTMLLQLKPTPNFAREQATITQKTDSIYIEDKTHLLILHTPYKANISSDTITIEFNLKEGEETFLGLSLHLKDTEIPSISQQALALAYQQTEIYWAWWIAQCNYQGPYIKTIQRSALTLKLLVFAPTGAVIAAATTSLPEKIGSHYNWDYRFTWLRDASFTIFALIGLGYLREAKQFMGWLEKVCLKENSIVQIMYGIHGEEELPEIELKHLKGYKNSKPVRIGNEAASQKQFDVFGEVLTAINLYTSTGGELNEAMKNFVVKFVNYCCTHWKEKDAGIWEGRGGDQHHTYSKLMCWAGVERGIQIAKRQNIQVNLKTWEETKQQIKEDILKHGYDPKIGAFVDTYDSDTIDATSLVIPVTGFLPPKDPKVLSTIDQVLQKLVIDWFVLRTSDDKDKLKAGEGTFFLCTLWLIDCFSLLGRVEEAKVWLEQIIHDATPLGLYAEEFEPLTKEHIGNFPQAYTHLGLINSILILHEAEIFGQEPKHTTQTQAERLLKIMKILHKPLTQKLTKLFNKEI